MKQLVFRRQVLLIGTVSGAPSLINNSLIRDPAKKDGQKEPRVIQDRKDSIY
jgi:hypothetical protein